MITKWIKRRTAKLSSRGLYLQDKELLKSNFNVGKHFKYVVDMKKKQIRIVPSTKETKNTVSKRQLKDGTKPVLDIRDKEALKAFQGADFLEVVIFENEILVRGIKERKIRKTSILNFLELKDTKSAFNTRIDKDELASVVGGFDFTISSNENLDLAENPTLFSEMPLLLRAVSLFSGAGCMDIPFTQNNFEVVCAVERNEEAALTYRYNHGNHIYVADITTFDKSIFQECSAPVMFGGSPCQGFSNSNRRLSFLDNPNNLLVREFIKSVQANKNCAIWVLENVPQLLTAGKGQFLNEIKSELSDFHITHGVLNSLEYGDAQDRQRAFLIGSKIGPISLPTPNVDSPRTVFDAFKGLYDEMPNQNDISDSRKRTIERMKCIPQGGNWQQLPDHLKTPGMFKRNTQSNIYKRLKWDEPACTIVNPRKCLLTHPEENRILSVRECARLFSIPDDFIFQGNLEAMQQQIANATPVRLVYAIAQKVKDAITSFNALLKRRFFSLV
ncbi:DNA cytosine methyltransferase [Lysinibacillus sp. UGB7]|uniref:DNA cytosine methyltransferase n=1 Tax=Lysinibacillus sp. UGB7 TaxID=3411039 RepID=UPI003B7B6E4B